ncbi:hypothetical protein [Shewanella sp. TB4-MNA-CIBAN-0142]|uniref:hypothetical protein n=1 Tax=Shewanella sp. TB4-MNA-CIBAN-0142 TaxID=3140464 RepID=UPI003322F8A8
MECSWCQLRYLALIGSTAATDGTYAATDGAYAASGGIKHVSGRFREQTEEAK